MLSPGWKGANYKINRCCSAPWPGSQEDIWDILDRDQINASFFFFLPFFCCFVVVLFALCKPWKCTMWYRKTTYLWVLCIVIFATFVDYHSLIWITVSLLNVCSLAVTLPLFDPAGVYCSVIISMVTSCNSINIRLSLLYDREAAGEPWRLIFQQSWDPAILVDILM